MNDKISAGQVLDTLREVVEEIGRNYRYWDTHEMCSYAENGEPSCLVGQVVFQLNPDLFREMSKAEGESSWPWNDPEEAEFVGVGEICGRAASFFTDDANKILAVAQTHQDAGGTHGGALDVAEDRARSLAMLHHPAGKGR